MADITCAGCGILKRHRARGLCIKCYDKVPRKIITCLGCGERKAHRARQLCDICYAGHGTEYPKLPHSMGIIKLEADERRDSQRVKPIAPTMARPGTEEKIQVMQKRHARMELLHHAYDCRLPKEIKNISVKSQNGGWHNTPSAIYSTPDVGGDE